MENRKPETKDYNSHLVKPRLKYRFGYKTTILRMGLNTGRRAYYFEERLMGPTLPYQSSPVFTGQDTTSEKRIIPFARPCSRGDQTASSTWFGSPDAARKKNPAAAGAVVAHACMQCESLPRRPFCHNSQCQPIKPPIVIICKSQNFVTRTIPAKTRYCTNTFPRNLLRKKRLDDYARRKTSRPICEDLIAVHG